MPTYQLINEKMLQVRLDNEQVFAKKGSMIAYQGDIEFARSFLAGGTVEDLAMRAATAETFLLMTARGTGDVYYAHFGLYVTIVDLQGDTFFVESDSLLAFDTRMRTGTVFLGSQGALQGVIRGAVTGHGLFTTTLQGAGQVAILSDGNAIGLEVNQQKPIFVDPDAYIGHVGQLTSKLVTDVSWKTFLGQTSGESYQLQFTGTGTVYIQASER